MSEQVTAGISVAKGDEQIQGASAAPDKFFEDNEKLAEISARMFGDGLTLKVVDPSRLTLLKDNARFFKRETFRQLRDNIASDKHLSSVPLCYQYQDGKLEVLSGNHRVQASIEAGLKKICVLVITSELEKSRRIAIQLSHNALVGEDDQSILANLWAQIDSVADKLYSGLDSELMKELGDVELVNFTTPQIPAHTVTFMFTEAEKDSLKEIMELLEAESARSSLVYLARGHQYEEFLGTVNRLKNCEKIRDGALALIKMLEIASEYLDAHEEPAPAQDCAEAQP